MVLHHNAKFGNKMFFGSEDINWTNFQNNNKNVCMPEKSHHHHHHHLRSWPNIPNPPPPLHINKCTHTWQNKMLTKLTIWWKKSFLKSLFHSPKCVHMVMSACVWNVRSMHEDLFVRYMESNSYAWRFICQERLETTQKVILVLPTKNKVWPFQLVTIHNLASLLSLDLVLWWVFFFFFFSLKFFFFQHLAAGTQAVCWNYTRMQPMSSFISYTVN